MKIIRLPGNLRLGIIAVLFCFPLVALETYIASRALWWNLPIQSIQAWSIIAISFFAVSNTVGALRAIAISIRKTINQISTNIAIAVNQCTIFLLVQNVLF